MCRECAASRVVALSTLQVQAWLAKAVWVTTRGLEGGHTSDMPLSKQLAHQ
jgi:hypothetical protein